MGDKKEEQKYDGINTSISDWFKIDSKWHHIGFVFDKGIPKSYLNGVENVRIKEDNKTD